jgi:membrane associated rhomboid family serine protease
MRQPPSWTEFLRYPVISGIALLATGVTVAGWAKLDVTPLVENAMIRHGELWRLVTSIFPHVGILHLIFNVYWLWVFGTLIEEIYGHIKTVALVLLFAIVPNALEYAFSSGGVGLSGVGYGLFGLLWILSKRDERFRDAIDQRTIRLFVIWFFFCIFATVTNLMLIGNIAHGTGAVLGILTGYAISLPGRRVTITACIGCIFVFAIWAATFGRPSVNLSAYGSYDECKRGYDAIEADRGKEALRWLQGAAGYRRNQPACQTDLAYVYHSLGREAESVAAYQKAAEMGDPDSQNYMGNLYAKGDSGAEKDSRKAAFWYHKAAEKGSAVVLNNVAWVMATSPDPALKNPTAALTYAQRAVRAEQEKPRAFILDTLAQAYYANEQYEQALATEYRALASATPEEQKDYTLKIQTFKLALAVQQKLPKQRKPA